VKDLYDIYRRLAIQWTRAQLVEHYRAAERRARSLAEGRDPASARPIAVLATAIPPSTTVSVAIHLVHALPSSAGGLLPDQLLETAERNVADALRRCQRALELDGAAHQYTVEDWLPAVYEIAHPLLRSARLDEEPPSVVRETQEAISWLSRAFVELDEDSSEPPSALAEVLARLLTLWIFAALARVDSASA
jgi:hypothetical protein